MNYPLISPSLLAADFYNLDSELKRVSKAELIHYDVMDGHFVIPISFGDKILTDLVNKTSFKYSVHLMVTNPKDVYPRYILKNVEEIIFHIETINSKKEVISLAQEIKKVTNVGISLKPETDINKVLEVLSYFDTVLVMSVQPGFGGQKFIEISLERVKTLSEYIKKNKLSTKIAIDGGINLDNYQNLINLGVDVLIMGSALFKLADPNKAIIDCHK